MNSMKRDIIYYTDIYVRVSKEDGDKEESNSIVNQKILIEQYIKTIPNICIHAIRADDGYTGVNFDRPAFQEMLEDIKRGNVNCVIVKDLSRFGRNYIEVGRYIERIFPYLGVRFIAIHDNFDSEKEYNPSNNMLIPFKNLINDIYCNDISVKVRSQLEAKRKRGDYVGAFTPYGYQKSKLNPNHLVVDEIVADVIRDIFKWKINGMSSLRIANKLNDLGINSPMEHKRYIGEKFVSSFNINSIAKWDANAVSRILKNEVYIGVLEQGKTFSPSYKVKKRMHQKKSLWVRIEHSHQAIIEYSTFYKVQKLLSQDTRVAPKQEALYLFSGILKCGICGGNMTRKIVPSGNKKFLYFVCTTRKQKGNCENKCNFPAAKLENIIRIIINKHVQVIIHPENIKIASKQYDKRTQIEEIAAIKQVELEKYRTYSLELYKDYKEKIINKEEYIELKKWYEKRCKQLEQIIINLNREQKIIENKKEEKEKQMISFKEKNKIEDITRNLILELIDEIRIFNKETIEIISNY